MVDRKGGRPGAVFVDTSAWYALFVSTDPAHDRATSIYERLKASGCLLICTDWILLETAALLHRRVGYVQSHRATAAILGNPRLEMIWMDHEIGTAAVERFQAAGPAVSLVDIGSFVAMERRGVSRAFAFDRDFTSAGFTLET